MDKKIADYNVQELKAMAFETAHQITLLRAAENDIIRELIKRNAIASKAEVSPDEL